jgi:hypothetical protein
MMEKILMETAAASLASQDTGPDLSIVLVCWNNKAYLEPCLDSLYERGMRHSFDVVVVDNGSTDGSQAMLREKYPDILIIQNDHNVGLGKASNQGAVATTGRHILLLNNDTLVDGAAFDAMVEFLDQHPQAGAVGAQLRYPDGTIQSNYNNFSTLREEFLIATRLGELIWPGYPANVTETEIKSVDWISSACLMVRRSAFEQVGLLDESYFIYGDEADLQYRFRQAGWEIYYLPQASIIHFGGRSMNRWGRRKMVYRGKMLFYQKNYGPFYTAILRLMLGLLSLAKLVPWLIGYLWPSSRQRAGKEITSNLEVIKLCWKLE